MLKKEHTYTAVFKKTARWYLGWIEEVPGVNTQAKTLDEARENLKEALLLVVQSNKELHNKDHGGLGIVRESLSLAL